MGLPNIVVEFMTKANTAITRSERGIVCLVVKDTTKTDTLYTYRSVADVVEEDWSKDNLQAIKDAFHDGPTRVYVVRLTEEGTFAEATEALDALKINWLAFIGEGQDAVTEYVKTRNAKKGAAPVKAVVAGVAADDMHVVNFGNTAVKRTGANAETAAYLYLGRIAGLLAAMSMEKTATYYVFDDLQSVTDVEDADSAVEAGQFVLFNDYGTVRVARAVNSATKVDKEDLKKIAIVEGMDLVREDIMTTFKEQYVGKYKNNADNQAVFVAAVNGYLRALGKSGVLNPDYENLAEIDVEAQRAALVAAGNVEALDWDDTAVKNHPHRSYVYVKANVQFSDGIEDLEFKIYMN
ncbi:MAG: phage tail sheath C-terminal domain-containing protein [Firmicutes bacterium]|nr:phage tail sheath C-terminal domain-containing protein [Bacillota bacterium]